MKRGSLSFLLFLVILAGPVIALNFGGPNVMGWVNARTAMFTAQEQPAVPEETLAEPATEDPFQWLNDRPALREVFIPDAFTSARYISVEKIVPVDDLLQSGETQPRNDQLALYAAARAPAQLIEYCTDVVATIGTACDVIYAEARENRDGDWVMNGRLSYIPLADLGTPQTVENGQLLTAKVVLPFTGDLAPANEAQSRIALLQQAQAACDTLRAELGNCVLARVSFDVEILWITDLEVLPAGTNPQRLDATAEFAVYADPTRIDSTAFTDLVEATLDPI